MEGCAITVVPLLSIYRRQSLPGQIDQKHSPKHSPNQSGKRVRDGEDDWHVVYLIPISIWQVVNESLAFLLVSLEERLLLPTPGFEKGQGVRNTRILMNLEISKNLGWVLATKVLWKSKGERHLMKSHEISKNFLFAFSTGNRALDSPPIETSGMQDFSPLRVPPRGPRIPMDAAVPSRCWTSMVWPSCSRDVANYIRANPSCPRRRRHHQQQQHYHHHHDEDSLEYRV